MDLKTYMYENKLSVKDVSKIFKYDPQYIRTILRGDRNPGPRLAYLINKLLNQKVVDDHSDKSKNEN